jgi:hypothetical protein
VGHDESRNTQLTENQRNQALGLEKGVAFGDLRMHRLPKCGDPGQFVCLDAQFSVF